MSNAVTHEDSLVTRDGLTGPPPESRVTWLGNFFMCTPPDATKIPRHSRPAPPVSSPPTRPTRAPPLLRAAPATRVRLTLVQSKLHDFSATGGQGAHRSDGGADSAVPPAGAGCRGGGADAPRAGGGGGVARRASVGDQVRLRGDPSQRRRDRRLRHHVRVPPHWAPHRRRQGTRRRRAG
jgi:hypothetical protein